MIIDKEFLPGNVLNREGWVPKQGWPRDCLIQWTKDTTTISVKGKLSLSVLYSFEAVPANPDTFIVVNAETLDEAEEKAYSTFQNYLNCPEHIYEHLSGQFTKTGAEMWYCLNCGLTRLNPFYKTPQEQEKVGEFDSLED